MNDNNFRKLADMILDIIEGKLKKKPQAYDTQAVVRRVDARTGTAYVHIPNGVDETPVRLTIDAEAGDTVQVRVADGRAWLTGNRTAPPTDDAEALVAKAVAAVADKNAAAASTKAAKAQETAEAVSGIAASAMTEAQAAKTIADNTEQHFWFTSTGTDTGAHITEVTQEEFTDPTDPNYQSGGNLLARSNGIAIRDGMDELAQFMADGIKLYDPATGQVRVTLDNNGAHLKGKVVLNNYSFADLLAQYFQIGYHNDGVGDIYSELFGQQGFGNFMYSRKEVMSSGVLQYFVSPKIDDTGFHIYHDRGIKPESGQTNFVETCRMVDGNIKAGTADSGGNMTSYVEMNAPAADNTHVIRAQSVLGDDVVDIEYSGGYANMTLLGEHTADGYIVRGHSTAIGSTRTGTNVSSLALTSGTTKYVSSVSLPKGTWVVTGKVGFPATSATNKAARVNISATSADTSMEYAVQSVMANIQTHIECVRIVTVTATSQTWYLNAFQNSGSQLTATNVHLEAVRIA